MHVLRRCSDDERGQILVLGALLLVVLLGMVAMVIDVGRFLRERQDVQNTVDAAALAGVQELPDSASAAEDIALEYALANDGELTAADVEISFRCVVGDRDGDGQPDMSDVPTVCDPGGGAVFTCQGSVCASSCSVTEKCNALVVESDKDVPFYFAPVLGQMVGNTGAINAAACRGSCGGNPTGPVDVVLIIDRTRSMSSSDLDNAKGGARAVLEFFDPDFQHVALAVLPQSRFDDACASVSNANMTNPASGDWLLVELSDDYQDPDGSLNESSALVSTIDCLERAPVPFGCWPGFICYQTNLGEPVKEARLHLGNEARDGIKQGIILFTDGEANLPGQPGPGNPCLYAYNQAHTAKTAFGVEIFTIGYGIDGARCTLDNGLYDDVLATELLADMATESEDDAGNGGCNTSAERDAENSDEDHFFCEARGDDLQPVFQAAAEAITKAPRLIRLP